MAQQTQMVWSGTEQEECVALCEKFRCAGIPFVVDQRRQQFLKGVEANYKIVVPGQYEEKAKKIISRTRFDFTDELEDQKVMELTDDGVSEREVRGPTPCQSLPLDAKFVQIYSEQRGVVSGKMWMVEASLRENEICYRTESHSDGSRSVVVLAKDEGFAREIVREINEGAPPT